MNTLISDIPNKAYKHGKPTLIQELIKRYKQRLKALWSKPNPFIKPLWEKSEIEQKIKELEKLVKHGTHNSRM